MNEIVNKILLAGDKFTSEMHLRQPGFTYSACGLITITKEIQIISTKMNWIKLVSLMMLHYLIVKI